MVVVMVLCPRRDKVWRGATMLAVEWFDSRPLRRGPRYGLRHCLLFS
jgi:hypothetical protein